MIMNTTTNSETEPVTIDQPSTLPDLDFCSIDGLVQDWRQRFPVSMLRVGRILLKNTNEVMGVSEARVSKLMARHRPEISEYTPLQIREELYECGGEIRGGGIKIEWMENLHKPYRSVPHYDFTFSRILRPEDYLKPEALNEPV
jgi:hypothetical protein